MESGQVPRGFEVDMTDADNCTIQYRATGVKAIGCFFAVWLTTWTSGCFFAIKCLVEEGWLHEFLIVWVVPACLLELFTIAYVLWFFRSVTIFTFSSDQLIVERSLWRYHRRRVFPRAEIRAAVQVKDGGEGEDSFPGWGLVLVAAARIKVLSRQPLEKSDWLGNFIATWAEVPFEPALPAHRERTESL